MNSLCRKIIQRRRKTKKERHVDTKSPSAAPSAIEEKLPVEVKRHVASFLPVRDLLKFSETSKQINRDLDIVVLSSPLTDRASQNKAFRTDETKQCFAAVIPNQEESLSHPTTFAFHVVTTPFIRGTIWVVEQDLPFNQSPEILKSLPFRRGKSVAKTKLTSSGAVNLPFFPKTGKFYQLWVSTRQSEDNWLSLNSGFDYDSQLYLNNMMLNYVGLGTTKALRHAAFQFDVPKGAFRRPMRPRRGIALK